MIGEYQKLARKFFIESASCRDYGELKALEEKYLDIFKSKNIDCFLDEQHMEKVRSDLANPSNWQNSEN